MQQDHRSTPIMTGTGGRKFEEQPDLFSSPETEEIDPPTEALSPDPIHPLIETLKKIDANQMTPMEALQLLADLSEQAKSQTS